MEYHPNNFKELVDFSTGAVLLIDKPKGFTSFDVVNKIRWLLKKKTGIKKIKVGHAGTLDPLATGLLVICTGKMTKQIQFMTSDDKTYKATIFIGKTTVSYDLESEPEGDYDIDHITNSKIQEIAQSFIGTQDQIPPIFSAKKINGKRAYLSAREGEKVEMKKNEITINNFEITEINMPLVQFTVNCSKGTYIRTIAHDFGHKLNSGAYLSDLVRTQSGNFSLKNALSIEDFEKRLNEIPTE